MKFEIKHEIKGRMRVRMHQKRMTCREADILLFYLSSQRHITGVKVREINCDATINYVGSRQEVINALQKFKYETAGVPENFLENSGRELNEHYKEQLINKVVIRGLNLLFVPKPIQAIIALWKSAKYICKGAKILLKGKIQVEVLDATAIGVSVLRNDTSTASSIMFLLSIGELLEEWTHKKSVDDLARSMSLNVSKVWKKVENTEQLVSCDDIKLNDEVVVHVGNVIPFDGEVIDGEAMVNQASLTGESVPVRKHKESYVYAGAVVEEGELTVKVKAIGGSSKFEKIVTMIEESEKLKSSLESKAERIADKLVPYTLLGTGAVYLFTRNVTRALSVLMVDFSCALKLAMPISVLSAIREAGLYNITVKGGKYLEAVAEADTIVFDKTGTLTKAKPTVVDVIPFNDFSANELLRIAACLEEHFPHSMAKAVVDKAKELRLTHEEMHSKVDYIVAHGISTKINDKKVIIGSHHFVFEDEKCTIPEDKKDIFANLKPEYSHLYMAIENELAAVICIEDPVREEAKGVVNALKKSGISKVVMMTGDSERTAKAIAEKVGVDEYYSEVLPEDKAKFVEMEKAKGRKVIMIGDGINDSPALYAANAGIAISDGAEIAREIADITIGADDLYEIVTLKAISNSLMKRINKNYKTIVAFNSALIFLGVAGIIQPTTSAMLHNTSTLAISLRSMQNLIK